MESLESEREGTIQLIQPASTQVNEDDNLQSLPESAIGFIALMSGDLVPFGVEPPEVEAKRIPCPSTWIEIKMCPVQTLLTNATLSCPSSFCNVKVKTYETHATYHLMSILEQRRIITMSDVVYKIPKNIKMQFYCRELTCYQGLKVLDVSRGFNKIKYLRQHFLKVHAPKIHACSGCSKLFSTMGLLGCHMKSCGYSFDCCECDRKYRTLEALQTHSRRTNHVCDYSKFKSIFDKAKNEIVERKKKVQKESGKAVNVSKGRSSQSTSTSQSTAEIVEHGCHQTRTRKRSAETQTGVKVPAEAQTLNAIKRKRPSKREETEAETQCSTPEFQWDLETIHLQDNHGPLMVEAEKLEENPLVYDARNIVDSSPQDGANEMENLFENMDSQLNSNSMEEFMVFEDLDQHTQTSPSMMDLFQEVSLEDDMANLMSFASAETQTSLGFVYGDELPTNANDDDSWDNMASQFLSFNNQESNNDYALSSTRSTQGGNEGGSPSYLNIIDGETQTNNFLNDQFDEWTSFLD